LERRRSSCIAVSSLAVLSFSTALLDTWEHVPIILERISENLHRRQECSATQTRSILRDGRHRARPWCRSTTVTPATPYETALLSHGVEDRVLVLQKLGGRGEFGDLASGEDKDAVAAKDGVETVSNDEATGARERMSVSKRIRATARASSSHGAVGELPADDSLDLLVRLGVDGSSSLVENEDLALAEEGALQREGEREPTAHGEARREIANSLQDT